MKRCPICLNELLSADSDCPQCGKVHYSSVYSANDGAFIYDRDKKKYLGTNDKIYATDFFFAYDKGSANLLTAGGASGFGIVGAVVGGLADGAISAIKSSTKRASTAVCYYWKDVASLTYPAEPIQTNFLGIHGSRKVDGRGIDIRLRDGKWLTIGVPGFSKNSGEELYQIMNMLHQKSITQDSVNQEENVVSQTVHTDDSVVQVSKTPADADTVQEKEAQQYQPVSFAGMVSGSGKLEFFKCAHCGVTQMREGNFCSYCGKPALVLEHAPEEKPTSLNAQITCPSCGNMQDIGGKFCFKCGQKLGAEPPAEKNCPYCGAKAKVGMLFCMECGTRLT